MRGRKPPGPEFVQRLEGSAQDKQRLEGVLRTTGNEPAHLTETAASLGISPQWLDTLRTRSLQAALDALQARPLGRPRQTATAEQERIVALEEENVRLRQELAASRLREEIALVLARRSERVEKKRGSAGDQRGPGRARRGVADGGGGPEPRPRRGARGH